LAADTAAAAAWVAAVAFATLRTTVASWGTSTVRIPTPASRLFSCEIVVASIAEARRKRTVYYKLFLTVPRTEGSTSFAQ
jgi:hypothetical protein